MLCLLQDVLNSEFTCKHFYLRYRKSPHLNNIESIISEFLTILLKATICSISLRGRLSTLKAVANSIVNTICVFFI